MHGCVVCSQVMRVGGFGMFEMEGFRSVICRCNCLLDAIYGVRDGGEEDDMKWAMHLKFFCSFNIHAQSTSQVNQSIRQSINQPLSYSVHAPLYFKNSLSPTTHRQAQLHPKKDSNSVPNRYRKQGRRKKQYILVLWAGVGRG